jgi:hypothetical protein
MSPAAQLSQALKQIGVLVMPETLELAAHMAGIIYTAGASPSMTRHLAAHATLSRAFTPQTMDYEP